MIQCKEEATTTKVARNRTKTSYCEEIEILSKQQKILRLEIRDSKKISDKYLSERKPIIKRVKKLRKKKANYKIDRMVEEIDTECNENTLAFKAIKGMKKIKTSRMEAKRFMMDKNGLVLNESEMPNSTKETFKNEFHNPNINLQYLREGQQKPQVSKIT